MNIAIINRKGGVSKTTLSKWLCKEFNRTGIPTDHVDTDIQHNNYSENGVIYNPSYDEIDDLLQNNKTTIFDTGGLISSVTDTLAQQCDLIIVPTGISNVELKELPELWNNFERLKIEAKKIIIVPTRIHYTISQEFVLNKMDHDFFVTPKMKMLSTYDNGRQDPRVDREIYNIAKSIQEYIECHLKIK